MASPVGTSPQQASTTSGSSPSAVLEAHFHSAAPTSSSSRASSSVSHVGAGCLPAKIAFTQLVDL